MSISRHHAEWRELIEVSGPFLSMAVLEQVFPQGIETVESELRERLRVAHEEWLDATSGPAPDLAIHQAFVRYVFREALGYHEGDVLQDHPSLRVDVPEHRDTLVATFAIANPDGRADKGKPRLFVSVLGAHENIDKPSAATAWKISPIDRMLYLLRGAQAAGSSARLGLVTNGDEWVLLYVAPNETSTYVRWSTELWFDEPLTLRALVTFISARRLFGVPADETFESLIFRSAKDAHEVTDRLGSQVRRATEVLVRTIDRVDRGRRGRLLEKLAPVTVYEGAVTVMMRLIFVLAAEERKLLLLGTPTYDQHYAVSTLHDQLQATADRHGEEVLEKRFDAWVRLLSTFRAIFAGIEHDQLRIAAHGGSLFDPDRFPFLEGRAVGTSFRDPGQKGAEPLAVDNRTVLHLLRAITRLEVKAGGGRVESRRLSFRELDVEQIGHVYEGLLDHTAKRADDITVSLAGKYEPEIPVSTLESYNKKSSDLVSYLAEETGRSASAIEGAFEYKIPKDEDRQLLAVCENVTTIYERVKPWAGLLRKDTHGLPVVIPKGALYVTEGADRRSTGTHYTPRTLTEPIVQHTLDPLVYEGPAEGKPRDAWELKSAKAILALRVCDLAMGSGAFLVEACRYLAARLVETWEFEENRHGGRLLLAPDGGLSAGASREQAIPTDTAERLALARRYVADRCLYGVDVNPWAVEMGKLSLWLTTMQKGRPFSFLDHALRSGDSLLGVTEENQLLHFHLEPARGKKLHNNLLGLHRHMRTMLARARELREKIEDFATDDINDARTKAYLLTQANEATEDLRVVADLLTGAALATSKRADSDDLLQALSLGVVRLLSAKPGDARIKPRGELQKRAAELLDTGRESHHAPRRPFHWVVEFPEVLGVGGFNAFVGNPPFRGGKLLSGVLGSDYREYLVEHIAGGRKGHADLCAYFFLRAAELLGTLGAAGLVATNTIAQGDTRDVGLNALLMKDLRITRAVASKPWPGDAALEVAHVWLTRGPWSGTVVLDERPVAAISAQLTVPGRTGGEPVKLKANAGKCYQGTVVLGTGFMLEEHAARELWSGAGRANKEVLSRYLGGEDVTTEPSQRASRFVINFRDWPLTRDMAGADYRGKVASDFPDCLDIVKRLVRPERARSKRAVYRDRWWMFAERQPALQRAIAGRQEVLVTVLHSKYLTIAQVDANQIFSHALAVFALSGDGAFACLQSNIHEAWARAYGSTLETRMRYTGSDCFETFPFPALTNGDVWEKAVNAGKLYREHRRSSCVARDEGSTKVLNAYHDRSVREASIQKLRELHVQMDLAVAQAYGWNDLHLGHGFHETKQGMRFTVSETGRVELLDRLLALNHRRYAEEVGAGLQGDGKPKPAKSKTTATKSSAKADAVAKPKRGHSKQTSILHGKE